MKPRLYSAPPTDCDFAIWFDWQVNRERDWRLWSALKRRSEESDRRDADLMLMFATWRYLGLDCEPGDNGHCVQAWVAGGLLE